ncbi:MAG: ElyC/SanA/YdcF family protein [Patescibacteria group bacterium]
MVTETGSFSTIEEAEAVKRAISDLESAHVLVISNRIHLARASASFERQGLRFREIAAEDILRDQYHQHQTDAGVIDHFPYEKFIENYLKSVETPRAKLIEAILRAISKIDQDGVLISGLARKLRHGEELN